ncbi:Mth938-like domain-containing protein [Sphingosinicella sp. LHD-64]|uniref:Mth938-like domain-containing protein n=1 Tax=Sphingosinicella sp. LHD-64 TaxID=3072139 RepID=UPI00280EBF6F|nr:Mth938-like domain-containing protein [Sphingosinicella sp. LHD-64]MDQ8755960.1 Mth938-like domain-containing protein [Sphingosinicella sp. LHD-64]
MTAPGFERTPAAGGPLVRGFSGNRFKIDGRTYEAVLLTPERAVMWEAPDLADLTAADVAPLLALDPAPEFVVLGTGRTTAPPPRAFVAVLEDKGIGVEAMGSRAAARTFGLLRGEGRWIAAALMPL